MKTARLARIEKLFLAQNPVAVETVYLNAPTRQNPEGWTMGNDPTIYATIEAVESAAAAAHPGKALVFFVFADTTVTDEPDPTKAL